MSGFPAPFCIHLMPPPGPSGKGARSSVFGNKRSSLLNGFTSKFRHSVLFTFCAVQAPVPEVPQHVQRRFIRPQLVALHHAVLHRALLFHGSVPQSRKSLFMFNGSGGSVHKAVWLRHGVTEQVADLLQSVRVEKWVQITRNTKLINI